MPLPVVDADQLAALISWKPPAVQAFGVGTRSPIGRPLPADAGLLAWGRYGAGQWVAGVAFLHEVRTDPPMRALITAWLSAAWIMPVDGQDYAAVPRISLVGRADDWPRLLPRHKDMTEQWRRLHQHALHADPLGEYRELWPAIREAMRQPGSHT